MKIAIGPVLFEWGRKGLREFYTRMAYETPADILYIGEVICSRRNSLTPDEMAALADELKPSGKEIVFSTLGLVMNENELVDLRQITALAQERGLLVEVNDLGGLAIAEGKPMVAGPHITTYNPETLDFLQQVGVKRACLPVELNQKMIGGIARKRRKGMELELFAFGKLPLTFSARCYTSRAFKLPKTNCQYKCGDFPDGMTMRTQEGEPFLTINGVETMSDKPMNLIGETESIQAMGIDVIRLSPQSQDMTEIVALWHQRLLGTISSEEALSRLSAINQNAPFCNGYYHGKPGLEFVEATKALLVD